MTPELPDRIPALPRTQGLTHPPRRGATTATDETATPTAPRPSRVVVIVQLVILTAIVVLLGLLLALPPESVDVTFTIEREMR
ncbi:MAG: hypothetical protein WC565_07475 [Parcubacteria group bacterium]